MNDNYFSFIDTSKLSSAKQLVEFKNQRNPIVQTDINTLKSTELLESLLSEIICSQKIANKQFLITVSVSIITLLLTGASFILNFI